MMTFSNRSACYFMACERRVNLHRMRILSHAYADDTVQVQIASFMSRSRKQVQVTFFMFRGRILGRNPDKSLRSFPPAIHSHSPNLLQFLQLSYRTVRSKEKGRKADGKQYPLLYGLRNPYRNTKSENSQDYALKPLKFGALSKKSLKTMNLYKGL
jgi:hypothetical protein